MRLCDWCRVHQPYKRIDEDGARTMPIATVPVTQADGTDSLTTKRGLTASTRHTVTMCIGGQALIS
jgi:3-dehydroquinate dehydratase